MAKLRYSGDSGKYAKLTLKELKDILKKNKVPGRANMKRRFDIINYLEQHEMQPSRASPKRRLSPRRS